MAILVACSLNITRISIPCFVRLVTFSFRYFLTGIGNTNPRNLSPIVSIISRMDQESIGPTYIVLRVLNNAPPMLMQLEI